VAVGGRRPEPVAAGPPPRFEALPSTFCSDIHYRGSAPPHFLIASDLPTRLGGRPSAQTARMRDAIAYVLARHRFRAGKYRIAYQSCDDSTREEGGSDPERCAANARAYARHKSLIGVVGPYHSFCAAIELPILNAAATGPLATISPTNTYVGLTHSGPGTTADEPDRYYPTGVRSYARVIGADDVQAAALAALAKQLGARRLFLLHDNQGSGYAIAKIAGAAARKLRLHVAGEAAWNPEAPGYEALARRVARAAPDAVVLGGCICENGPRLVRDLRAILDRHVALLAPDAFVPPPDDDSFLRARAAFDGLYITTPGLPVERLGRAGDKFRRAFMRGRRGAELDSYAVHAAQATKVLLDAIARSNGTRASVASELLESHVTSDLLGSFTFDRNGDPSSAPVSVFRLDLSGPPRVVAGARVPGAVLDRVITPPRRLVD
jgi:branched-chain amino acid transport system substrate-binding protein